MGTAAAGHDGCSYVAMIEISNRGQFRRYWNNIKPGLGDADSPLWALEREDYRPSRWFVSVRPVDTDTIPKHRRFWLWCNQHCRGQVICYSHDTDNDQQWWGFTHRADIFLWVLKWSR